MEIQEILEEIKFFKAGFPYEAIHFAELQKAKITPHLLNILQNAVTNYEQISDNQVDYLFAIFLLSKFREQKSFPLITQLASLPSEWPEKLLGDFITEALPSFFISTFDGNFNFIKQLVENPNANEWSRLAALKAFLGLFALNRITREEIIAYLKILFHSPLAKEEFFMTALVSTASDIYPEELLPEIEQAFEHDLVDYFLIDEDCIKDNLDKGKEKCLQENIYDDEHFQPVNNVAEKLSGLVGFLEDNEEEEDNSDDEYLLDWEPEPISTNVRSKPKLGRNDPCICGSGKKYKKCCLRLN